MHKKIIVALDFSSQTEAIAFLQHIDPSMCRVKVGKELFTATGPVIIDAIHKLGFEIFLDLKYHDIPNTVAKACQVAANLGVWMINLHTLGGEKMMAAAANMVATCTHRPLLIGVTILTSMDQQQLHGIGIETTIEQQVIRLASLAKKSGLDGVVCSANEISSIRQNIASPFALVTPGIRPEGSSTDDQKRIMTPQQALTTGSDYLVIGRPITAAREPQIALQNIIASITTI